MKKLSFNFLILLPLLILSIIACKRDEDEGPNPPRITSVSPAQVHAGESVTLNGNNLETVTHVIIDDEEIDFELNADNSITFIVPENLGPGDYEVRVINPDGEDTETITVLADEVHEPQITSVSPSEAEAGSEVTVSGVNFFDFVSITIGDISLDLEEDVAYGEEEFTFTVPEDLEPGTVTIRVETEHGEASHEFTVLPAWTGNEHVVYTEGRLNPDWKLWDGWGGTEADLQNTETGNYAIRIDFAEKGGGFQLHPEGGLDNINAYSRVIFSMKAGEGFGGTTYRISVREIDGENPAEEEKFEFTLEEGAFQQIVVPFNELGNPDSIEELVIQSYNDDPVTIFVEHIELSNNGLIGIF